jgi:hypothetical protein
LPKGNPKESCSLHKQWAAAVVNNRSNHTSFYFPGNLGQHFRALKNTVLNNGACAALKSRMKSLQNEKAFILNKHPSLSPQPRKYHSSPQTLLKYFLETFLEKHLSLFP